MTASNVSRILYIKRRLQSNSPLHLRFYLLSQIKECLTNGLLQDAKSCFGNGIEIESFFNSLVDTLAEQNDLQCNNFTVHASEIYKQVYCLWIDLCIFLIRSSAHDSDTSQLTVKLSCRFLRQWFTILNSFYLPLASRCENDDNKSIAHHCHILLLSFQDTQLYKILDLTKCLAERSKTAAAAELVISIFQCLTAKRDILHIDATANIEIKAMVIALEQNQNALYFETPLRYIYGLQEHEFLHYAKDSLWLELIMKLLHGVMVSSPTSDSLTSVVFSLLERSCETESCYILELAKNDALLRWVVESTACRRTGLHLNKCMIDLVYRFMIDVPGFVSNYGESCVRSLARGMRTICLEDQHLDANSCGLQETTELLQAIIARTILHVEHSHSIEKDKSEQLISVESLLRNACRLINTSLTLYTKMSEFPQTSSIITHTLPSVLVLVGDCLEASAIHGDPQQDIQVHCEIQQFNTIFGEITQLHTAHHQSFKEHTMILVWNQLARIAGGINNLSGNKQTNLNISFRDHYLKLLETMPVNLTLRESEKTLRKLKILISALLFVQQKLEKEHNILVLLSAIVSLPNVTSNTTSKDCSLLTYLWKCGIPQHVFFRLIKGWVNGLNSAQLRNIIALFIGEHTEEWQKLNQGVCCTERKINGVQDHIKLRLAFPWLYCEDSTSYILETETSLWGFFVLRLLFDNYNAIADVVSDSFEDWLALAKITGSAIIALVILNCIQFDAYLGTRMSLTDFHDLCFCAFNAPHINKQWLSYGVTPFFQRQCVRKLLESLSSSTAGLYKNNSVIVRLLQLPHNNAMHFGEGEEMLHLLRTNTHILEVCLKRLWNLGFWDEPQRELDVMELRALALTARIIRHSPEMILKFFQTDHSIISDVYIRVLKATFGSDEALKTLKDLIGLLDIFANNPAQGNQEQNTALASLVEQLAEISLNRDDLVSETFNLLLNEGIQDILITSGTSYVYHSIAVRQLLWKHLHSTSLSSRAVEVFRSVINLLKKDPDSDNLTRKILEPCLEQREIYIDAQSRDVLKLSFCHSFLSADVETMGAFLDLLPDLFELKYLHWSSDILFFLIHHLPKMLNGIHTSKMSSIERREKVKNSFLSICDENSSYLCLAKKTILDLDF